MDFYPDDSDQRRHSAAIYLQLALERNHGDCRDFDLAGAEATIELNGTELGRGFGSLIMGHPLEALAWLANRLSERGRHLKAGEFVTLGSVIPTHWVSRGDHINHEIPGLGSVSIRLA